jgi:hypothetical protein
MLLAILCVIFWAAVAFAQPTITATATATPTPTPTPTPTVTPTPTPTLTPAGGYVTPLALPSPPPAPCEQIVISCYDNVPPSATNPGVPCEVDMTGALTVPLNDVAYFTATDAFTKAPPNVASLTFNVNGKNISFPLSGPAAIPASPAGMYIITLAESGYTETRPNPMCSDTLTVKVP